MIDGISIHALREEGDTGPRGAPAHRLFLSTPSARRATHALRLHRGGLRISIHALREEGDGRRRFCSVLPSYFYPRPPREGDTPPFLRVRVPENFYPRPPRGGRLAQHLVTSGRCRISIHALREEGDVSCSFVWAPLFISIHALREEGDRLTRRSPFAYRDFYPRPPRGGRPAPNAEAGRAVGISIHALREEGDLYPCIVVQYVVDFYPRPPRGGRRSGLEGVGVAHEISIHALREEGDSKNRDKISIFL